MQQFVDAVAGAGYEGVRLSNDRKAVEAKRYAAEIVEPEAQPIALESTVLASYKPARLYGSRWGALVDGC